MEFTLRVEMDNAAFENPGELARILRALADVLADGVQPGDSDNVRDANGNTVGEWDVSEDRNRFRR